MEKDPAFVATNSSVVDSSSPTPNDELTITVGDCEDEHGTAFGFYVEDDGIGIPESDRESIFESGFTTSSQRTGFGLAIVQSIAHAHEWSIDLVESETGGARFEITNVDFP